jgi:2TM domain-containing protein
MTSSVQDPPEITVPEEMRAPRTVEEEYTRRYKSAKQRVEQVRGFFVHLTTYLAVNAFLFVLNMITSPDNLWFYWPLIGWGIAVLLQAVSVFGPSSRFGRQWEERKIREYMEKDR